MDIVNRLKIYMESKGIGSTQFADSCKIPRPTLSQILSGRNKKISDEVIEILDVMKESIILNSHDDTEEVDRIEKIKEYIEKREDGIEKRYNYLDKKYAEIKKVLSSEIEQINIIYKLN